MHLKQRLLQKSEFVIPEVLIGNPCSFEDNTSWIPLLNAHTSDFAGMTPIAYPGFAEKDV